MLSSQGEGNIGIIPHSYLKGRLKSREGGPGDLMSTAGVQTWRRPGYRSSNMAKKGQRAIGPHSCNLYPLEWRRFYGNGSGTVAILCG